MRDRRQLVLFGALLALPTVVAFLPLRHNGFISFDDPAYITSNPHVAAGLTGAGLIWALTATAAGNWHPLTWAAHMLDVSLFGMNPAAHHLSGLALHTLNAVLLFLVLAALTGRRRLSAWVAALFALHPLHVESVAWASERKDLLSGLFWMLTLGAYVRYARRPGVGRYAVIFLSLALGLMAKPMLVTAPVVLLLLDWWPLGRTAARPGGAAPPGVRSPSRLVAEKIPLLALSCASSVVTLLVQREAGFVKGLDLIPIVPRLFNAAVAYVSYLAKTAWPFELSPFYPHLGPETSLGAILVSLGVLLAVSFATRLAWSSRPWLVVGWLWYLGTLLPVIGVVQVGWQAMADRYTYLPLIGIFFAIVWEADRRAGGQPARRALVAGGLLILAGLGALTWRQTRFWRDNVSVFSRAAAVTPGNMMAEYYLGTAYRLGGKTEEAIRHLREASRINPRIPGIYVELGLTLSGRGDLHGAIRAYERALQLEPESASTHNNLGHAYYRLDLPERALKHYEAALRIKPRYALARTNAAMALARLGRDGEAEQYLRQAQADDQAQP
jgi:tetratricopeptide (TPR) repeat protein